jgi:hypothetical protein
VLGVQWPNEYKAALAGPRLPLKLLLARQQCQQSAHALTARLWTLLQLFLGACIANNVAWKHVSYNEYMTYKLAGGVSVCVLNMVRGTKRCHGPVT